MATAFTSARRDEIEAGLLAAARRQLCSGSMNSCTVDELAREAGISKGAFYHFFKSKEHLFLRTLESIQDDIYGEAERVLFADEKRPLRQRAMDAFYDVCRAADQSGLVSFLRQDLPRLLSRLPDGLLRKHYISDHERIRRLIVKSGAALKVSVDEACSVLWLMVMSLVFKPDVGEGFHNALRILVEGVCDRVLA
ncbi:MAG: TetR/AcrR family transcriptional regulator [Clostridiales bacterium]|nr:TetR/AcrR family transcriptional regulator [Clostridiales bacterium]